MDAASVLTTVGDGIPARVADSKGNFGLMPYAVDPKAATRLWSLNEELTGVNFLGGT